MSPSQQEEEEKGKCVGAECRPGGVCLAIDKKQRDYNNNSTDTSETSKQTLKNDDDEDDDDERKKAITVSHQ